MPSHCSRDKQSKVPSAAGSLAREIDTLGKSPSGELGSCVGKSVEEGRVVGSARELQKEINEELRAAHAHVSQLQAQLHSHRRQVPMPC